jgi:hypothetical protein
MSVILRAQGGKTAGHYSRTAGQSGSRHCRVSPGQQGDDLVGVALVVA